MACAQYRRLETRVSCPSLPPFKAHHENRVKRRALFWDWAERFGVSLGCVVRKGSVRSSPRGQRKLLNKQVPTGASLWSGLLAVCTDPPPMFWRLPVGFKGSNKQASLSTTLVGTLLAAKSHTSFPGGGLDRGPRSIRGRCPWALQSSRRVLRGLMTEL